ncbi:hypothetical protein HELRODRAFT_193606, partial [Helobdella robusta]|uniref:Protein kinase domain-containing protein n=1 Tax=Helobdella robusta TaxID=6412 RepID=T1FV63_HELRO
MMELELLDKKIRRLNLKLKKHNIYLHIFDHTDIHYGPTLGKGGEGIVQKCTVRYNELLVDAAVKTVLNNTDDGLEITFDEIEMLCLAHDPIMTTTIKVYGVAAVPDREDPTHGHLVIIMEAGIKNALQLYQDETIPFHVTLDLWHRLAVSLHCIHKKNIIHQDLKPENVLITGLFRDHYGILERLEAKVIDLGMARLVEGGKVVTEDVLGTTGYHSPEVLFDETYDFKADVFVLGITFCVMLLNQLTLRTAPLQAFLKRVHEAKERGLVGQSLFFSVIQPLIDKDICLPTVISEMI